MKTIICLATAIALTSPLSAAIIIVAPTSTVAGSFTITDNIVLTNTTLGDQAIRGIVLVDLVNTTDGALTGAALSPDFNFELNGNPGSEPSMFQDNVVANASALGIGDGAVVSNATFGSYAEGETFTIVSGSYVIAPTADFNSLTTQTFTGQVFLTNTAGFQVSNVVTIPEPGYAALLAIGVGGMLRRKRVAA